MTQLVALIGDSIFDNESYVPRGMSVIEQLHGKLVQPWRCKLLAVDGATSPSVVNYQLAKIPHDTSHLILSVGGNDALRVAGTMFTRKATDVRQALEQVDKACAEFAQTYARLLRDLASRSVSLSVCTIYDSIPGLGAAERAGLCLFNDVITRNAATVGATLIDLRLICSEYTDYSTVSPIEPSATGGEKIAKAIVCAIAPSNVARRTIC